MKKDIKKEIRRIPNLKNCNLNVLDVRILKIMYTGRFWDINSFFMIDLEKILGFKRKKLYYHLKKLSKMGLIETINSYPKMWEPVKDESVKKTVDVLIKSLLKDLERKNSIRPSLL